MYTYSQSGTLQTTTFHHKILTGGDLIDGVDR